MNETEHTSKRKREEPDTFYGLLQVEEDSSFDQVHKAFRRLSRTYHPDAFSSASKKKQKQKQKEKEKRKKTTEENSDDLFKRLVEAKETLTDRDKRIAYNVSVFGDGRSKWTGSEARAFEDSFYHDMQTKTSKSHVEKPAPIVVHQRLAIAGWMNNPKDVRIDVEFDRTSLCLTCQGYGCVPVGWTSEGYTRSGLEVFTQECPACTGAGVLLLDPSVHSKERSKEHLAAKQGEKHEDNEEGPSRTEGSIEYCTPSAHSTTITAEIATCECCEGRKRVFHESQETEKCTECDGLGTTQINSAACHIPIPSHFDAVTKTALLVLLGEGHEPLPNAVAGDVHVIFELMDYPLRFKLTPNLTHQSGNKEEAAEEAMLASFVSPMDEMCPFEEKRVRFSSIYSNSTSDHASSDSEDTLSEEEDILSEEEEEKEEEKDDVRCRRWTQSLKASTDGKDFTLQMEIDLEKAICGFALKIPMYWVVSDYTSRSFVIMGSEAFALNKGIITWTGDSWIVKGRGPRQCVFCDMPALLMPSDSVREETPKTLGVYPGFAPCMFAKRHIEEEMGRIVHMWGIFGCAVSPQRYPAHPENAHISLIRVSSDDAFGRSLSAYSKEPVARGNLRIDFTVMAPRSYKQPETFYRTFAWCCDKMKIGQDSRKPVVYQTKSDDSA